MLNMKKLLTKIANEIKSLQTSKQNTLSVQTISTNVTTSTGQYISSSCRRYGKVVWLAISFRNTSSTASGGNVYVATFTNTLPRPVALTNGAGFYGAIPLIASLTNGRVITIRNASTLSLTIGSGSNAMVSFTYITDD